jgi:hypothetical protein
MIYIYHLIYMMYTLSLMSLLFSKLLEHNITDPFLTYTHIYIYMRNKGPTTDGAVDVSRLVAHYLRKSAHQVRHY